jgi:hypothetical protein
MDAFILYKNNQNVRNHKNGWLQINLKNNQPPHTSMQHLARRSWPDGPQQSATFIGEIVW